MIKHVLKRSRLLSRLYRLHLRYYIANDDVLLGGVRKLTEEADVVVDVGANTGFFSVALAREARQVYAFEPLPQHYDALNDLHLKNLHIQNCALGEVTGEANIRVPRRGGRLAGGYATLLPENALDGAEQVESIEIKVVNFDEFWDKNGSGRIEFVKIDVEGFELFVLKGMERTAAKFCPSFLVEIERRHNPAYMDVFRWFIDRGYNICAAKKNGAVERVEASDVERLQVEYGQPQYVNNFFFVRPELTDRITTET